MALSDDPSASRDSDAEPPSDPGPPRQVRELQCRVDSLARENAVLKAQFDDVIEESSKFKSICEANVELTKRVHQLQARSDDAAQRIQILLAKRAKPPPEGRDCECQTDADLGAAPHGADFEALRDSYEAQQVLLQRFQSQQAEVLAAASQYFSAQIQDFASLLSNFLERATARNPGPRDTKWKRKICQLRAQQAQQNGECQEKMSALVSDVQQQRQQFQKEISQLEQACRRHQQNFEEISQKKRVCEEENAQLRSQLELLQQQESQNEYRDKFFAMKTAHKAMKIQLGAALSRVASLTKWREHARSKIKQFQQGICELQADVTELHTEKEGLTEHYTHLFDAFERAKKDIERLTSAESQSGEIIATQKRQIERFAKGMERCEELIRQQSVEIETEQAAKAKLIGFLRTQTAIETRLIELVELKPTPREDFEPIRSKFDFGITGLASSIPGLPSGLSPIIAEIESDEHMRPDSKVRQILRVVCEWFQTEIARIESHFNARISENVKLINEFQACFPELRFDGAAFGQALADIIKRQSRELSELRASLQSHDTVHTNLLLAMDSSTAEDAHGHFLELKQRKEEIEQSYLRLKRKLKNKRNAWDSKQKDLESNINALNKQIEITKEELNQTKHRNAELDEELVACRQNTIDSTRIAQLAQIEVQLKASLSSVELKLQEEIHQNYAIQAKLEQKQHEISNLSNQVVLLRVQNRKQSGKLKAVRSELSDAFARRQAPEQHNRVSTNYQQIIEDLRTRNSEFQQEVCTLTENVTQLENANQCLRTKNSDLALEIERCRSRTEHLEREVGRVATVSESEVQTIALKHEFELRNKVEDLRSEFEHRERELIGFFALHFSSIVDLTEQLGTAAFKAIVHKLRAEFERLIRQEHNLRLLLSLSPMHSLEDAVAGLLLTFPS